MSWQQSHWLGAETYEEYLRKWREQHDACIAFFDEDRADRELDYKPCVDHPLRSTRVLRLADAGGTTRVRQPTGTPDLPDAA